MPNAFRTHPRKMKINVLLASKDALCDGKSHLGAPPWVHASLSPSSMLYGLGSNLKWNEIVAYDDDDYVPSNTKTLRHETSTGNSH